MANGTSNRDHLPLEATALEDESHPSDAGRETCQGDSPSLACSFRNEYAEGTFSAGGGKGPKMQERSDRDFIEPVVLVRVPFQMLADVARETVTRTHELVARLTRSAPDAPAGPDTQATPAESR